MKTDKIIRMRLSAWRMLRSNFPTAPNETVSSYMNRLANYFGGKL